MDTEHKPLDLAAFLSDAQQVLEALALAQHHKDRGDALSDANRQIERLRADLDVKTDELRAAVETISTIQRSQQPQQYAQLLHKNQQLVEENARLQRFADRAYDQYAELHACAEADGSLLREANGQIERLTTFQRIRRAGHCDR